MNYKIKNEYFLKIPEKFLVDFNIKGIDLEKSISKYIKNNYLTDNAKIFKVKINDDNFNTIIFHKIELNENNKSAKKGKRVLIFILLNKPEGINTIFPIFSFLVQEEKKYTTKFLHTKEFIYKIMRNFQKYKGGNDYKGNTLNNNLGIKI